MRPKYTPMWKTPLLYLAFVYGMLGVVCFVAAQTSGSINIENPLSPNTSTLVDLITSITTQLTPFAITIAIFSIVLIGVKFVFAAVQGDASGIKEARKYLLWVIIGTAIVVAANGLAAATRDFFSHL